MARRGAEHDRSDTDDGAGEGHVDRTGSTGRLNRRTYLGLAGAAMASGVIATGSVSAATRVDVVDVGADPTGSDDSTGAIDDALAEAEEEVYLPNGTYLTSGGHDLNGKRILGESRDGTVLQLTDSGELFSSGADGWEIRRMKWDVTHGTDSLDDMENNEYLQCYFEHDGTLADVWINGVQARVSDSGAPQVFALQDADGTIRFERLYMPDGTGNPDEMNALKFIGSFSDWGFTGTLELVECDVRYAANNFIYTGSPSGGPSMDVLVDTCYFENNNVGMRPPSGGTFTVQNTVVDNTGTPPVQDHSQDQYDGDQSARGIWIPGYIDSDCTVVVDNVDMDTGDYSGITMDGGRLEMSNSTVVGGVDAPDGIVVDSCVDDVEGVSTDNVTSGCAPDLSLNVDLAPPYDPGGDSSDGDSGGSSLSAIGETGTVETAQADADDWHRVSLDGSYTDPVVVMTPSSYDGPHPSHVRLRDVTAGSFEYKIEEWNYLDGRHTSEAMGYVVVEAGTHDLADGTRIEAGTTRTAHHFADVAFAREFDATPVVLSQAQTFEGPHPVVTRTRDVSAGGVSLKVQEEEAEGPHTTETVGYVALGQGAGATDGTAYEAGTTGDTVTDEWHAVSFEQSYDSPTFVADMQTVDGWQPSGLRCRNLTGEGVDVFVEEEWSSDDETNHVSEVVGYAVFDGAGSLSGT